MHSNLKLVRIKYANQQLYIIGKYSFWKNIFAGHNLILTDCFLVDFTWNREHGHVEQIFINSLSLLKSHDTVSINKFNILFETTPDAELCSVYEDMRIKLEETKDKADLL